MKIAISINEVLRDFIGQFIYTYNKYVSETNISNKDITSFNLIDYFKFEDKDKFNSFLYLEAPLEIFGHADQLHDNIMNQLNEFLIDLKYDNEHEVEIVSREVNKAIPSTMFFLSKTGARAEKIRFVNDHKDEWDGVDVLITANPIALESKPNGKISVKIKTSYNEKITADYELDSISEFFKDKTLRDKILTPIITITYEELN